MDFTKIVNGVAQTALAATDSTAFHGIARPYMRSLAMKALSSKGDILSIISSANLKHTSPTVIISRWVLGIKTLFRTGLGIDMDHCEINPIVTYFKAHDIILCENENVCPLESDTCDQNAVCIFVNTFYCVLTENLEYLVWFVVAVVYISVHTRISKRINKHVLGPLFFEGKGAPLPMVPTGDALASTAVAAATSALGPPSEAAADKPVEESKNGDDMPPADPTPDAAPKEDTPNAGTEETLTGTLHASGDVTTTTSETAPTIVASSVTSGSSNKSKRGGRK